jgi:hypothetical protein
VDALGSLDDAIAEAKVQGGLARDADTDFLILPKGRSFLDNLLEGRLDTKAPTLSIPKLAKAANLPELSGHLRNLGGLMQLRSEPVWLIVPHGVRIQP